MVCGEGFSTPNRISESTLASLARKEKPNSHAFEFELGQKLFLTTFPEAPDKFMVKIEVVLNGCFALARNEENLFDAIGFEFLSHILNYRLLGYRKHLFWLRLGGRKQSRT